MACAQAASLAWEQLGDLTLAVDSAAKCGDMERALPLSRQTKAMIPEELAVAVKALRLLQQLEQKHHALRDEDGACDLEQLAALHTVI